MLLRSTGGSEIFGGTKGFSANTLLKTLRLYRGFRDAKDIFVDTLLRTMGVSGGFGVAKGSFGTLLGLTGKP